MRNFTTLGNRRRGWLLLWAVLLLSVLPGGAGAQSGPVGNEWIVPSQTYYKIKITRDGIYKLNSQYLTQMNLSSVAPSRLQIWRRGRELAVYGGGNQSTLDATTFLEFYGQRNDGRLDTELYKNPANQNDPYYSFYTDTAAYFLTWNSAVGGRRMAQPVAAGGVVHPHRLTSQRNLKVFRYLDYPPERDVYLPWLEPGEGYFDARGANTPPNLPYVPEDSVIRNVAPTGPAPSVEISLFGASDGAHAAEIQVVMPGATPASRVLRTLGIMRWNGRTRALGRFQLLRSDIDAGGRITISNHLATSAVSGDDYYVSFLRVMAPQLSRWFTNTHSVAFQNDSLLAGPATYEFAADSIPYTVAGFDVQDPYNVQRVVNAGASTASRRYVFPGANTGATHRLLLADEAALAVPTLPARLITFRTINPALPTFVIITHPLLMQPEPVSGVANAAQEYANYRASAAGGSYNVLMVTAPELYDQFHYGERSWLALRHFSRWLVAANPTATNRYLLLLGKGIVPSEPVANTRYTYYRNAGESGLDLVPTSSRAVSDNLLTADYANNDWVAKLHTGRLTAITPRQVMNYLNKVRTHDSLGPAPWRKNFLHLAGGLAPLETQSFVNSLNAAKVRIERPLLGGKVVKTEAKSTALPVPVNIAAELNAGLSVIDYFGHASNNRFTLNFGAPSTEPTYANTGRYPVLILNGCAANATFTVGYTIVEDFLFADQKGAIGSLAESGFGFPSELAIELDSLHKLLFNDPNWYGKPVTVVHDELVRRLQTNVNFQGNSGIEQLLTRNWQGDPTIAIYSPPLPDFIASNNTLSVGPVLNQGPVKADSPNLVLNVGVANPGKVTYAPLQIRVVQRRAPNLDVITTFSLRQSWQPDTTYALTLRNAFVGKGGTTTFLVTLDYNNLIPESNENNNAAQIDFAFLTGGVAVVNPTEFAIVATTTPTLTIQSNNPNETSRGYEFELSPDPAFPASSVRATITGSVLAEWQPTLPTVSGRDSVVYYWRARFQTPAAGEDNSWVTSSFRVIPGSPSGWSQSHYGQFKRDTRLGIDVGVPLGVWAFTRVSDPLVLRTIGGGRPRSAAQFSTLVGGGIYLQSQGLPVNYYCGTSSPNLLLGVYDSLTLRPVPMPAKYQKCGQAPNSFYFFSTTSTTDTLDNLNYSVARQQRLDSFLRAVPNGAYVAAVSMNRLRYSLLPAYLKNRLQSLLGSQLITTLADGEPLALVGQKMTATSGRLLSEVGPDRSSGTAAYNQRVELRTALTRSGAHGRILSTRIGPAQEWLNLYHEIRIRTAGGHDTLRVVGIASNGTETVVLPRVTATSQSLTTAVPAATYPYLRLELSVSDTTTRVPPQLKQWLITSRGLPEGVVLRDAVPASTYAAATLLAQATGTGMVVFPVKFKNVSSETFNGPLITRVLVRRPGGSVLRTFPDIPTPAPAPGATATITVSIDLKGLYGPMVIEVVVNPQLQNPQLQPEQNYTNNQLILPEFNVINNNVPPTLDVAIDDRHILNGELVSSTPVIVVQLNDEDKLVHIQDRNAFTLTLQRPGQAVATLVDLNGSDIAFNLNTSNGSQARLTFEPAKNGPLPDGVYTLRAQGRDPNNATAAAQEVTLRFEVVNAATITNVYPYPNPVISKARFVFTVTGHELPRNMKIQIMSLTGRVVREIFMNELGPLHLGNNITDYAWDGTDSYGDRLANGTYLYRVAYDDNVGFSHRDSAGDKAFKNDWGKLVLMR